MAWDYRALRGEIDRAVAGYAARIARETATARVGLVTAELRLDGALVDLVVDPRALRRHSPDELAVLMTEAIRAAEHEASALRDVLGEEVTFHGRPVQALVREMIADPQGTARRLAAEADVRRQ